MDGIPRQQDSNDLPRLLAEYGHLAAQLPASSTTRAAALRVRLAELDELIDDHVRRLSGRDSVVDG
ncbi:hypothetical protein [Saccharopolyspora rosea]|uniref:Uncharacterized protein n=1 Tax=Saccharopolyspora rosea TaxID=524884 RepID=A0ABW3FRL8_9PSEU|nr:hypothetical protein [Saccharopolyspora rosea]